MNRIRILIAEDHALVRSGFRALLSTQPDFEVVGEAVDGVVVVEICRRLAPDVVLMDLTMPGRGGIQAIEDLRRSCPGPRVLVVSMHENPIYPRLAFLSGATGYVLKQSLDKELLVAIRQVHRGQRCVTPSLVEALDPPEAHRPSSTPVSPLETLTAREREIVVLLALGHTNAEIADRLHISDRTVETHRMHCMAKLRLRRRAELVRFALDHGLMNA